MACSAVLLNFSFFALLLQSSDTILQKNATEEMALGIQYLDYVPLHRVLSALVHHIRLAMYRL